MRAAVLSLPLLALAALPAAAACPEAADVQAYAADVAAGKPTRAPLPPEATVADANCARDMLTELLATELGPRVGWKAGLTSEPAQARFGVSAPVLGALLEGMMLEDGATVKVADGVRPLFEADLVAVVADEGINTARTPEEALAHLAGVRPFLELPDLPFAEGAPVNGPILTAINVGAWRGVIGPLIEIPKGREGVEMLAAMTARLTDASGAELSAVPGAAILGNPLNAVIWIAEALAAQGKALQAGDLLSLGSIGPLHPMKPGMTVTLTYVGLPGTPTLTASFE